MLGNSRSVEIEASRETLFQRIEAIIDRLGLGSKIPNELRLQLSKIIEELYFQRSTWTAIDEVLEQSKKNEDLQKELDATSKGLREQEADLAQQKNAFKAAKEATERRLREEEKRISDQKRESEGERTKLETLRKGIEERERDVKIREEGADSGLQQIKSDREKIRAEREQNQRDAQENSNRLSDLDNATLEAKRQKEIADKTRAETIELQKRFWPDCLLTPEWENWRASIQERALVDSNAAVLLAALQMCYATAKTDKNDLMYEALSQTGAHLFPRFADQAERLTEAFNEMANRRYRLQLPKPGQPTDSTWMNFKPGLTTVSSVFSWAVFDSEGRIRHRANVK